MKTFILCFGIIHTLRNQKRWVGSQNSHVCYNIKNVTFINKVLLQVGWVGSKKAKSWWHNTWMVPKGATSIYFYNFFVPITPQVLEWLQNTFFQTKLKGKGHKVRIEKNPTGLKRAIDEKTIICFVWSWNFVKMISSCQDYFDKVSWL